MDKLRTAVLVTFFTVLIWALAEGESLQTKRTVVDVEFPRMVADAYTVRVADTSTWRGGSRSRSRVRRRAWTGWSRC